MNKTEKTYLSLYEKGRMSETQRAYFTIWLLYNDRLKLEKLPRTSKIEAKIEELRSLELQLKRAVTDPKFVRRLEQSAVREAMERSEKHSQEQRQKRAKRQTWKGLTREQLTERNQKIVDHFKKNRLKPSSYAQRYAAKNGLSPRSVRLILSKAVGNLPG